MITIANSNLKWNQLVMDRKKLLELAQNQLILFAVSKQWLNAATCKINNNEQPFPTIWSPHTKRCWGAASLPD